jgi:hypothetical protein
MLENIMLWKSFFLGKFGEDISALILVPLGNQWMDIIVGEMTEIQFYCLRTSLKVIPITSNIPYNIGPEYIAEVEQLIGNMIT